MARGGKRPGAGRPRGSLTKKSQEILIAAAAAGEQPLEYLLRIMRDPTVDARTRLDVAIAACPYLHPRLASTQIKAEVDTHQVVTFRTIYDGGMVGLIGVGSDPEAIKTIMHQGNPHYDADARAADQAELAALKSTPAAPHLSFPAADV
jgi:hypothetical protein